MVNYKLCFGTDYMNTSDTFGIIILCNMYILNSALKRLKSSYYNLQ